MRSKTLRLKKSNRMRSRSKRVKRTKRTKRVKRTKRTKRTKNTSRKRIRRKKRSQRGGSLESKIETLGLNLKKLADFVKTNAEAQYSLCKVVIEDKERRDEEVRHLDYDSEGDDEGATAEAATAEAATAEAEEAVVARHRQVAQEARNQLEARRVAGRGLPSRELSDSSW